MSLCRDRDITVYLPWFHSYLMFSRPLALQDNSISTLQAVRHWKAQDREWCGNLTPNTILKAIAATGVPGSSFTTICTHLSRVRLWRKPSTSIHMQHPKEATCQHYTPSSAPAFGWASGGLMTTRASQRSTPTRFFQNPAFLSLVEDLRQR